MRKKGAKVQKDIKASWRNRIVGEAEIAPGEFLTNPHNFREHPAKQQAALRAALGELGWIQRVIVNRQTQHVIDGHARIALALERQEPTVPVVFVDLSEHEERLALATFDPLAALVDVNAERLGTLLHEVNTGDATLY